MIKGVHITYLTRHPDRIRAFFRDKLRFPFTEVGGGWLIFDVPDSEIAAHPLDDESEARAPATTPDGGPAGSFVEI
jgi:hypothetical protein